MKRLIGILGLVALLVSSSMAQADYMKGAIAEGSGSFEEALREYRKAAEQGGVSSQHRLGEIYEKGYIIPQDYEEAVKWYGMAAELGHANSQTSLGVMYEKGKGIPKNYQKAFYWYGKAVEQGNRDGMVRLGEMYLNDESPLQNIVIAHMWFNLATSASILELIKESRAYTDDPLALFSEKDRRAQDSVAKARDLLAEKMTSQQISDAQKLARECFARNYKAC